jgi:cob(I)alamin adenosyltransferase
MKGFVHVYTGNGKGKTTAALGLVLRASGAGLRSYFCQFIKGRDTSETIALRDRFPNVTVEQFGEGRFLRGNKPSEADIELARRGLTALTAAVSSGDYDLVVADEANCAVTAGLFPVDELLRIIDSKSANVELVFTGRGADAQLIARADLVTEMAAIKHYFDEGQAARPGIEE